MTSLWVTLTFIVSCLSLNPYRRCSDNPLYTSDSLTNYMFAMPSSSLEATNSLIYFDIKQYGFTLLNPGLGDCANYFLSKTSCCNITTVPKMLSYFYQIYQGYANITNLPLVTAAKDLRSLVAGPNSTCLKSNGSLNNLRLPGVNGETYTSVPSNIGSAFQTHDSQMSLLKSIEVGIINSHACLLCLATVDWDRFIAQNHSVIYNLTFYQNVIANYTNILNSLTSVHTTLSTYVQNFVNQNIDSAKCPQLATNYTSKISSYSLCSSNDTCNAFSKQYFGSVMLPGVVWKMQRLYLGRTDATYPDEPPAFGNGLSGNISYST